MLVKKINPAWYPSEKKDLMVGETIDITDPKGLILGGDVVAIDENGVEISAYDLYGVIVKTEREEFEEYLKLRKAQALEKELKRQQVELKEEMGKTATEVATQGAAITATEANKITDPGLKMSWAEMTKKGRELGIYKVGMKRADLEAALLAKK